MSAIANVNHQVRLAARPVGLPTRDDWRFSEEPIAMPDDGGITARVVMLSLDPAMRGWMNEGKSYIPPVALGDVMRAVGIGRVHASRNPSFAEGDWVTGTFGVQEFATVGAAELRRYGVAKIFPDLAPLPKWLNPLGMPGMTAYFGLLEVGQPVAGETVVVSGAAGAVGQTVGQIARIKGCRAVGIAGGPAKCKFVVDELGFDACIDYKSEDVRDALKRECPQGVNVYFDNVGGEILEAALARLARKARIVICGAISQYNATGPMKGPSNYMSLLVNRARMEGMVVFDYADRYPIAVRDIAGWIKEGKFKSREDIVDGLANFPDTLNSLFRGENFGKLILRIASD